MFYVCQGMEVYGVLEMCVMSVTLGEVVHEQSGEVQGEGCDVVRNGVF